MPGLFLRYDENLRVQLDQQDIQDRRRLVRNPVEGLEPFVGGATAARPAYVILSRAQAAETYLRGALPAETLQRMDSALSKKWGYIPVYRSEDAVVYRYQGGKSGDGS